MMEPPPFRIMPGSTARLTNSRLHDAGTVCISPWPSCTQSGNTNC